MYYNLTFCNQEHPFLLMSVIRDQTSKKKIKKDQSLKLLKSKKSSFRSSPVEDQQEGSFGYLLKLEYFF